MVALAPLVVIVGPTASGKSQLGLEAARRYAGEIICADSRTIYRGLNVGTAKPSQQDMLQIRHHLVDILDPDQSYSAAEFKEAALELIAQISSRGHLPIMVGGSGLYIDSVLFDYQFPAGADNELRRELSALSHDQLLSRLDAVDPTLRAEIDTQNSRRVIRAIETAGQPRDRQPLRESTLVLGLAPNNEVIRQRIYVRAVAMVAGGLAAEVTALSHQYGWDCPALTASGYRQLRPLLEHGASPEELARRLATLHYQLSRRQLSWLRRNPDVQWLETAEAAWPLIADFGSRR